MKYSFYPINHKAEVVGSLWVWSRVSIHRKFQASVGYLVKLCHHDDNDNDSDDVMKAFYISTNSY